MCEHPKRKDYLRYAALTEWRGATPADYNTYNVLRKELTRLVPNRLKRFIRSVQNRQAF
jgi:hypothetical protein